MNEVIRKEKETENNTMQKSHRHYDLLYDTRDSKEFSIAICHLNSNRMSNSRTFCNICAKRSCLSKKWDFFFYPFFLQKSEMLILVIEKKTEKEGKE